MATERVVLRRRHSAQLKASVLEQCAVPGASVAKVAMSHGLNANIVHGWRPARTRARRRCRCANTKYGDPCQAGCGRAAVRASVAHAHLIAADAGAAAGRHPDRTAPRRHGHEDCLADHSGN